MNPSFASAPAIAGAGRRGVLCLAVALMLGALMALAGSASAKVIHVEEGSFTGADTPAGEFGFIPVGVAVDNSGDSGTGDVWVASTSGVFSPGRVFKFDADGTYAGVELDGSTTPAGSFGFGFSEGSGFGVADGLAIDDSSGPESGDLYVVDSADKVVDRFSESGTFECQISGTAPPSGAECGGPGSPSVPGGEMVPAAAAVDPVDGSIYIANAATASIDKFNESGEFESEIADPHITQPASLAVDAAGDLFVANGSLASGGTDVVEFGPAGTYEATLTESDSPVRVETDDGNGHVYVGSGLGGGLRDFDSGGTEVSTFAGQAFSIGVSSTSHRVYVSGTGHVEIFSGPYVVPNITSEPASGIEETTALVGGTVEPDAADGGGEVDSCQVEFGPTTSYGESVPCSPAAPYTSTTSVSAQLSGLSPTSTYHFRISASDGAPVAGHSEDRTFNTKGPPLVEGESAVEVGHFGATLGATITAGGYDTSYRIEYVDQRHFEEEGFGSSATRTTAAADAGSGLEAATVSQEVGGLAGETTYHYRVVATNAKGTVSGTGSTFTTLPVAEFGVAYPIARTRSAVAQARIDPLGLPTSCEVEYVEDEAFKATGWADAEVLPCTPQDLGSGNEFGWVKTELTDLAPGATYHVRFRVTNSSGTLTGGEGTLTTFGVKAFTMEALGEDGEPVTQAGAHPYELTTYLAVNGNHVQSSEDNAPTATLKDVRTELPPGLIGNPTSVPRCPQRLEEELRCPPDTQIGIIRVSLVGGPSGEEGLPQPLFNLLPPDGVAARFGAWINGQASAFIQAGVRTGGDYGVDADSLNISSFANLKSVRIRLWGDPGASGHDAERYCPTEFERYETPCVATELTKRPFLSMPTRCTGSPLVVDGSVDTYQEPDERFAIRTEMPALTGCDALGFAPSLEARPTTSVADSPSGLHVDLHVAQNEEEEGLRAADLRNATVTLPPGLVVNPSGANGLAGCGMEQFGVTTPVGTSPITTTAGPAECPAASRIGTAEIDTPLLDHPITGGVYIAQPYENPFHSLLAIYIGVQDPISGVVVKLAGHVEADPRTGRLTTSFDENPQLPFEDFKLDFLEGAKAPLRTPAVCGEYETTSVLTPWSAPESGPSPTPAGRYGIGHAPAGGDCATSAAALPSAPGFTAGTISPAAGAYSPMVVHLSREDGTQEFEKITITPPPGLLAKLAGIPYCSDPDLAAAAHKSGAEEEKSPSCPAASEVGTVRVGAGAGPSPYYVDGHVYLAGPYKGAPLSLAIVTPATAGPFDLGTAVVRVALQVNPESTQITALSDPVPYILDGIPLDVRSISLELGRPGFTLNPTSCEATSFTSRLIGLEGGAASPSSHFQVGGCEALKFRPGLKLSLKGATGRTGHPGIRAVVTYPKEGAYANIARAQVNLPHGEFLDQGNLNRTCTKPVLLAGNCPKSTIYGRAKAWTPLLAKPLQGYVYLVGGYGYKLPALVAELNGQIKILLVGRVDSGKNKGIRSTFEAVPDAPVSRFVLEMKGGKKYGLLENSENLCRASKSDRRAIARFTGQNGAVEAFKPEVANSCKKAKKKSHAKHHHGGKKG